MRRHELSDFEWSVIKSLLPNKSVVDAEGRPITLSLSPGQAHDGVVAQALADLLRDGTALLADKAYDSDAVRSMAEEAGAWANTPPRRNRKGSFVFNQWLYRQRNLVERFFDKLKQFRGLATRYDKRPENIIAAIKRASIRSWLRSL